MGGLGNISRGQQAASGGGGRLAAVAAPAALLLEAAAAPALLASDCPVVLAADATHRPCKLVASWSADTADLSRPRLSTHPRRSTRGALLLPMQKESTVASCISPPLQTLLPARVQEPHAFL